MDLNKRLRLICPFCGRAFKPTFKLNHRYMRNHSRISDYRIEIGAGIFKTKSKREKCPGSGMEM